MHHLFQLTNSATRITESTSSCLDLIMTQSPHIVSRTEVLPAICSDHSVPCAYIRNTVIKNKPFKRIIYNYSKLDSNKFCNLLTNVNWRNIMSLLLHYPTDLSVKASSLLFGKFLTLPPCTKRGPRSFVTTIAPFLC